MQANRSDATPEPHCGLEDILHAQEKAEAAILVVLLSREYQGPWTVADLKSALGSPEEAVHDALSELHRSGLIYAHEGIVFPRLAARTMDRLDL
jgi:predicted transcriptional regulator